MKRTLLLLLVVLPGAAPAVGPPPVDDAHDLVVLHPKRPYRLRFHLRQSGRSFQAPWASQVDALFTHLDADGNGRLSVKELAQAPGREQWRQMALGQTRLDPEAAPTMREVAGNAKEVTPAQLRAYYQPGAAGPLRVTSAWRFRQGDPIAARLFTHLDRNRDGKLTRAELLDAPRLLKQLDRDQDELVSASELMGVEFYYFPLTATAPGSAHGVVPGGLPFFSVRPALRADAPVKALLARYDRDRDGKLTLKEVGLPDAVFARLDRDRNGQLDARELAGWLRQPPDLELTVHLDRLGGEAVRLHGPGPDQLRARAGHGGLAVRVEDWWIEMRGLGSTTRTSRAPPGATSFDDLDTDGDGFFTSTEAHRPPFLHVALLRLADRDGDGKVSRKEHAAFESFRRRVRGVVTSMTVEDQGRSLHRWLDTDGDGRLGLRELRDAAARLVEVGGTRTNFAAKDVPQGYVLSFWHGPLEDATREASFLQRRLRQPRGPLWFRKMDRNGDGDVSRSEWLGAAAQFKKFDLDGDGLLSAEEADKADRLYRKKASLP